MKILVVGATGRTGRLLLQQALHRGYVVHALVRNKNKIAAQDNLILFEGQPTDADLLATAMTGCTAILNTLNISRTSDFPWSPLRSPKDLLSATIRELIQVCEKQNCRRIILTSAWGVNESKKDVPGWFRWFIDNSNIRYPYLDHGRVEDILKTSSLDWTIVRPTGLINSKKRKNIITSINNNPKPALTISRMDVGRFMLDALEEELYLRQVVTVSSKKYN